MFDTSNLFGFLPIRPYEKDDLTMEEIQEVCIVSAFFGCVGYMAAVVTGMLLLALFTSCGSSKNIPVVQLCDSIRAEVVTNTVYVPDTQYVTLPAQIVERTTPDTASTIRTSFAESTAAIRGGLLYHVLYNLDVALPVQVQHKETVRDNIVYRKKEVAVPVIQMVEKPLSSWQLFRIWIGNIVLAVLAGGAAFWIFKKRTWWLRIFRR